MPEALALCAVLAAAVVIYAAMWVRSRDPKLHRPEEERKRLQHQAEWLDGRLGVARREGWGDEMVAGLLREQEATAAQLEQARAGERPVVNPRGDGGGRRP